MASYNKVVLVGNLTRDPDSRLTGNGHAVAEFGLAVNDRRKDASGEWVEKVTFVDITAFGRTAEVISEYLHKGSQVLIDGKLELDQWEDKNGGGKRSKLRVICDKMVMLGSKGGGGSRNDDGGGSQDGYSPPYDDNEAPAGDPSDIPF